MHNDLDDDVIDLVPVEVNGQTVYVDPSLATTPVVATPDGRVRIDRADDGASPEFVAQIPNERFAGKPTQQQLAEMIQAIDAAEQGRAHLPVLATPDGKLRLQNATGEDTVVTSLPSERFAASLAAERDEVRRIDSSGRYWRHTADYAGAKRGDLSGWIVELENDFGDSYVFFVESQPSVLYQAQLVRPSVLDLPGHTNHMVQNGVVCVNERLGHPDLTKMHGALAKWIFYSGCIRRGWDAPYSK